jgi:hypothetical protein
VHSPSQQFLYEHLPKHVFVHSPQHFSEHLPSRGFSAFTCSAPFFEYLPSHDFSHSPAQQFFSEDLP